MTPPFKNLSQIKNGLSKKKVFRKIGKSLNKIIIDFSEDEKEFINFLKVYKILIKINISIPKIYEVYFNKKIIVMEDFGKNSFDIIFQNKDVYNLLKLAVDNLIVIQNSVSRDDLDKLEKYTCSMLIEEISEFVDYYIPYIKVYDFPLYNFYELWKKNYKNQKFDINGFVHKDFEFINLFYLKKNNLHLKCGIIDFQSAFCGFKGWDLFSILEYSRLNFTAEYNEALLKYFYENSNISIDFKVFKDQYYLLNLARQTRLLGRWIKLFNEGNEDYLKFIEPTKKRLISCLKHIKDHKLKQIYENVISL